MWFKKKRLETPFKGDNVKALIKTPNCKNIGQKIAEIAMLFWFSVTKQSLEMILASSNDLTYPRYSLVLKFNVTLARSLRLVIPYFFMEILVR